MLNWYSLAAPADPPDPPVPVTVPVLYPAHIVVPFAGVAVPNVGDTGNDPTVQVLMVLHVVFVHP
jgi:hypothetical protein